MGRPLADRTETQTLPPIIWNPKTVDNYHDAIVIGRDALAQGDNIILDDGLIEKVPGTTKGNSDTPASACMGLHRTYAPDGTKVCLRLSNGIIKSGPSAFATTVLSNLATNKRTPWVDIRGKAYGINETDGIIRYDAKTALGYKTGIVGPYLRKKIAFFESDETWSTTVGGSTTTAVRRAEEWSGKAVVSLKLNCSAASTTAYSSRTVPLNLTVFDDSKAVVDDDYITFYTFHDLRNNLSACRVTFSTRGTALTHSYQASVLQEKFTKGDYQWTKWNVRKGAFTTLSGTPDWSKVSACRLTAISNTNGLCNVNFDYLYLKAAPIKPFEVRKTIFNCEGTNETWVGHTHMSFAPKSHEGHRSIRLSAVGGAGAAVSASCALATALDLTKWPDGNATSESDQISFWLYCNDIAALTDNNPLTLWMGTDASNYVKRTWTRLSALGLTGSNQWIEVRETRARISAAGAGAFNWNSISYLRFTTGTFAGTNKLLWIDDCKFEQKNESKQIGTMETTETWTITGKGVMVTDPQGKGWVTEGSQALKLWSPSPGRWGESSALYSFTTAVKNLAIFDDGTASTTDDYICFSLFHQLAGKIGYVELWLDNNSLATFVDGYKVRIEKTDFAMAGVKNRKGKEIRIRKADFDVIGAGAVGAWSTIGAAKFVVYSKGDKKEGSVYLDDLILRRKSGKTGRYYYKYLFRVADIASACSEDSEYIDVKGSKVSVTNIKSAQDSRVTSREVYRLGGSYPETWMLVKIIGDNTTTEITDDVNDDELTSPMGEDVPQGWVNSVLGNNLAHDPQVDRALYWGDPTYKNRVYFSHPSYYHVVDEAGYREFPDEVMAVVPWFGQNVIFYKNRIQKVMGDIATGELVDLPAKKGACSYWAVGKPYKGLIPFVGWDNIYLFDGMRESPIGDEIRGYFKGRESYLSTVAIGENKDVLYIACKDKTGTPTYNDTVLRCFLPSKSWTVLPDWDVNVWSNWDKCDDQNELYYGSSTNGNIYSINSSGYLFDATNITCTIGSGWISNPLGSLAITRIEFQAKGTAASTLILVGYKDLVEATVGTATMTLTTDWQVFRIGIKNLMALMRGNYLKIEFLQQNQNAYCKIKDVVIYTELVADRVSITTSNEIRFTVPG